MANGCCPESRPDLKLSQCERCGHLRDVSLRAAVPDNLREMDDVNPVRAVDRGLDVHVERVPDFRRGGSDVQLKLENLESL